MYLLKYLLAITLTVTTTNKQKQKQKQESWHSTCEQNFSEKEWVVSCLFYNVYEVQNLGNKLICCFYVWGFKFEYNAIEKGKVYSHEKFSVLYELRLSSAHIWHPMVIYTYYHYTHSFLPHFLFLIVGSWAQRR